MLIHVRTTTLTSSRPPEICAMTGSPTFIGGKAGFGISFQLQKGLV